MLSHSGKYRPVQKGKKTSGATLLQLQCQSQHCTAQSSDSNDVFMISNNARGCFITNATLVYISAEKQDEIPYHKNNRFTVSADYKLLYLSIMWLC